jgi:hypothetical protein
VCRKDCASYVQMRCDINLPQYVCCAYRFMVTGEDVSVYEMKSSKDGVRCVRDMCRRVRMRQGWFNIRGRYRRFGVSCQQMYLLCYVMRLWSYGGHVNIGRIGRG